MWYGYVMMYTVSILLGYLFGKELAKLHVPPRRVLYITLLWALWSIHSIMLWTGAYIT